MVALAAIVACGGGTSDPRCVAKQALRDAVQAVARAETAETAGEVEEVRRQIGEVERLVGVARRNVLRSSTSSIDRGMLEAAEYLEFIVGDFRASGVVDAALAQFASRELNRAPTPGEAPLGC